MNPTLPQLLRHRNTHFFFSLLFSCIFFLEVDVKIVSLPKFTPRSGQFILLRITKIKTNGLSRLLILQGDGPAKIGTKRRQNIPSYLPSMSEPTFSFSTTAEEVATCFSGEIKGKPVGFLFSFRTHAQTSASLDHRVVHRWDRIRSRSCYREARQTRSYNRLQ